MEMVTRAFGGAERLGEMYEIQGLGVAPEKQGRGYATALMRAVLEKVRPTQSCCGTAG